MKQGKPTKSQQIYEDLSEQIRRSDLSGGSRLPTQRELVKRYGVSRPTVIRALNRLSEDGIVDRRVGSGNYVRQDKPGAKSIGRLFGLLIPKLGITEIFEPICARMAERSKLYNYHLLWGDSAAHNGGSVGADLERACERYLEEGVSGLFFVPLELVPESEETNARIVERLSASETPVVMLDSDYVPFPDRGRFDLVGIDNVSAGYRATRHYLDQGALRVDFFCRPYSAYTVDTRLRGCRLALAEENIALPDARIHKGEPSEPDFVRGVIESGARNIICGNDATAVSLIETLQLLSQRVPEDVRVLGFDNVRYARHTSVPLTTFSQPCTELGEQAIGTMLSRLERPERPIMTSRAEAQLLVRQSSIIP